MNVAARVFEKSILAKSILARSQYLLDTDILSQSSKPRLPVEYVTFMQRVPLIDMFISVVTLGEVRRGIASADDPIKRAQLGYWLEHDVYARFGSRFLVLDDEVMSTWAHMVVATGRKLGQLPAMDGLIAATALHHGLTVVTRNTADFGLFGVPMYNPFKDQP